MIAIATAAAIAGSAVLVIRMSELRVSREATVGDLRLRVERARWLVDHMDHGKQFGKPASMMPGMPAFGHERLNVELMLFNTSQSRRVFDFDELSLRAEDGTTFSISWSQRDEIALEPGQLIHTIGFFDVPESDDALMLRWRRDGETNNLIVTYTPDHHDDAEASDIPPEEWPPTVDWLPAGDPERGAKLYAEKYSCAACHGVPGARGSETAGPNLAGIGAQAATRVAGQGAAQYLYTSLVDPRAFVAPACAGGRPCAEPSRMPEFAPLLSVRDMSDLLSYLLAL